MSSERESAAGSLCGFTVIDLSTGPAGAMATMMLGDHGARVIRLCPPDEDSCRKGGYLVWDRGKERYAFDISNVDAFESQEFEQLVRGADVLVEDLAPASPIRPALDHDRLEALNPALVSCSITAYGLKGPLKDQPPIDDLVLARVGILSSMPGFRPAPVHLVHPLPSVGAAILADLGITSALLAREKNARGRAVQTSLMAGALLYHPKVVGEHLSPHVFQTNPSGSAPFYSVYECKCGNWVQLGCVHLGFIGRAAKLMNIAQRLEDPIYGGGHQPKTPQADADLRALLTEIIKTRTYEDWAADFEAADIPFAKARQSEEGLDDPQIAHNEMVVTLDDSTVGPIRQMGVAVALSATPGCVRGPRQPVRAELPVLAPLLVRSPSAQGHEPSTPPLSGVRVLEITNLIAGPTGGRLLADLGADVIKLEPLTGDMSRPIGRTYFYSVNFNKRSISVDTSGEEGKRLVQRVASSSDVVLANLRPHATERMGIGNAINPQLIETHLTGYGWTGPYSKRPGIDPLAQALMGLQRAQGGEYNQPVFPAQLAPTDFTTGALGAFGSVLALLARSRFGVVQRVDSNLLSGGIMLSSQWFTDYSGKPKRTLADKAQYGLNPFHRLYRLSDGWVYVAAQTAAQRQALLRVMSCEGLEGAPPAAQVHANDTPLAKALAERFAQVATADISDTLTRAGVAYSEAVPGDSKVFLGDPHAIENGMVASVAHPKAGQLQVAVQLIQFADTPPPQAKATPLLGQHVREVLEELGYSQEQIGQLYECGVVKTESAGK